MKFKKFLNDFIIVFLITLAVTVIITFVWNLLFHNTGAPNWETSFQLSLIFAVIIPLTGIKS